MRHRPSFSVVGLVAVALLVVQNLVFFQNYGGSPRNEEKSVAVSSKNFQRLSSNKENEVELSSRFNTSTIHEEDEALSSNPSNTSIPRITIYAFDNLTTSPNTIVTAYFRMDSKHSATQYNQWMANMLSLNDAMVIFTSPDMVDLMKQARSHAWNRTVIMALEKLQDLPVVHFPYSFQENPFATQDYWQQQFKRDVQRHMHKSHQLFWIWLSKTWFVTQAIQHNYFQSHYYLWSDIGCFRNTRYNSRTLMKHTHWIPQNAILSMAMRTPNPPSQLFFDAKFKTPQHFFHSGSLLAGRATVWQRFHILFLDTLGGFVKVHRKVSDDQLVLQSTCLRFPVCAYIPHTLVEDEDAYFGIRHVLHADGGNYTLWWPPVWKEPTTWMTETSNRAMVWNQTQRFGTIDT